MEHLHLISVLASNLGVVALAWSLYTVVGYLLFRRALRVCPCLVRFNLYPLLGWAFLVPFAYYLRILPFPFSVSGPWALGLLIVVLLIWNRGFPRPALRRPLPLVLALLFGLFILNLLPLYFRLAIPDMRDVGTWGYDQRNYVYTAAGLLDEGLLPRAPHDATPWGFFRPYWEYAVDSLRQIISTHPAQLDWSYLELQDKFETLRAASRDFALFPRRAFSSLDALMASWLRIDPQQAYTLSIWIHHIWLLHIAVIFARLLRLTTLGWALAILMVVYWPNSHLAMAADNRDQANCLILLFLLFILGTLRHGRFWPTITCLCGVLVGYPELAIPALVAFYAQRYDTAGRPSIWVKQMGRELGTSLLCLLPLLPPALLGLLYQWASGSENRGLAFPIQYAAPLARFDYLPGWKLLWRDLPAIHIFGLLLDIMILLLVAYGLIVVFRQRKFGILVGYGAVLACGCVFLWRREYYPAYKVMTILWPFFLWLLLLPLSGTRPLPSMPRFALGRYRYAPAVLVILASVPAVLSVAQIPFPGSYRLEGANYLLADQLSNEIKSILRPRLSDINRLEQISRKVSKKKHHVLVIADIPLSSPHDIGFAQLLLRKKSVFFPQSLAKDGRVWRYSAYPNARAASSHQPIDRILLLNSSETFDFHRADRHIFGGTFDEGAFRQMNFSADLPLRKREHVVILCRSTPSPQGGRMNVGKHSFLFENDELALDIYNVNAPVGQVERLSFSIISPDSANGQLEVSLNGQLVEVTGGSGPVSSWSLVLDPEAMHQKLVVRIKQKDPGVAASSWRFEMTGFESALPNGNHKVTEN